MHVLLIGARGSGKTTLAQTLAERLGRPWVDLDELTMAHFEQNSITAIWKEHGESAWRDAEVKALRQLLGENDDGDDDDKQEPPDDSIIALGGGAPIIPEARTMIEQAVRAKRACAVYLETSLDTLRERLRRDRGDRPSLTGADAVDETAEVLAEREPIYRAVASVIIATDGRSPDQVADEIARHLRGWTSSA